MSLKRKINPNRRRDLMKQILESKGFLRIMEAHNGLSAILVNEAKMCLENGDTKGYDCIWASSLTDSASKGCPDIELLGMESRLRTVQEMMMVSDLPIVVDGDTGGEASHFEYLCSRLERMGVSAVIIEDKVHPKRNSLDKNAMQNLESPSVFANKIIRGKSVIDSKGFMIIARLESLIANKGMADALYRAEKYIQAGADGILIHSNKSNPEEVLTFATRFKGLTESMGVKVPLICIPTTYSQVKEDELIANGINGVIYANHMLRAAMKSMEEVSLSILTNGRSYECQEACTPVSHLFDTVGFIDVREKDKRYKNLIGGTEND